jgi:hypothetical protein
MTNRPEFGPDYGHELWEEPDDRVPGEHMSAAEFELKDLEEEAWEVEHLDPEDNELHVRGQTCERCGSAISATQEARLRPDGHWVHEVCPPIHHHPV